MTRTSFIFTAVLAAAILAGMTAGQDLRADEAGAPKETVTPLLKTDVLGAEGKEVIIAHLSVPPGFATAKHFHPGQVFLYVLEGAVTIEMEGDAPLKLGPGDVLQEEPGRPMVGKNLSTTHGAKVIVFQIVDKGKPLMVKSE